VGSRRGRGSWENAWQSRRIEKRAGRTKRKITAKWFLLIKFLPKKTVFLKSTNLDETGI
jgi:hypothetical protein